MPSNMQISPASPVNPSRKELRQMMRTKRTLLSPAARRHAAIKLLHALRKCPAFQYSQHIAIYLTADGEIDTSFVVQDLKKRGKTLYLPTLSPFKKGELYFLRWEKFTKFTENRFGIAEPVLRSNQLIPTPFIQLICMPLVAFDLQGNRLGMGGGFYDRSLRFMHQSAHGPALVGLAYELQKVSLLPTESWDVPLFGVATEKDFYRFC